MKAIGYARYSPRRSESDSIEAQTADIESFCCAKDWELERVFSDPATSGTVGLWDRPGLAGAMREIKRGQVLVVRSISRVARTPTIGIAIETEIERKGANLAVIEDGGLQSWEPEAKLARHIRYVMHEYERVTTNRRTSRRMRQHQADGRAMSKRPPYGWKRLEDQSLIEDDFEQAVIREVMQLRKAGCSYAVIVKHLEDRGIKPRGSRWYKSQIERIVKRSEK